MKKQGKSTNSKKNSTLEIEQLKTELEKVKTQLLKALADYQNLEKQIEREKENIIHLVKKEVFKDLIDLFTDLFIALENLKDKKDDPYIQGIFMVLQKYKDLLKKHGVEEIKYEEGDAYEVEHAEVIAVESHDKHNNKVKQTVEPGYKIGPYLLRPAKVIVYKKNK